MKKEEIFEGIKDLIKTLSSCNLSNDIIRGKWLEKERKIQKAFKEISDEDRRWIEGRYKEWHASAIVREMDAEPLRLANKSLGIF